MKREIAAYVAARTDRDNKTRAAKEAQEVLRLATRALAEKMVDEGLKNTRDDQGRLFSLRPSLFYKSGKAYTDRILAWLEQRGLDPEQFWAPKIEKKRLNETVLAVYEKEGVAPLPDSETGIPQWLELDRTPTISVLNWKEQDDDEEE